MTLLAKMRDRRGSLRVSTICGSPMALSMRSAAVAYASGLRLHSARYSSSESSSSRVRSKRAAKLLITSMRTSLIGPMPRQLSCRRHLGSSDGVPAVRARAPSELSGLLNPVGSTPRAIQHTDPARLHALSKALERTLLDPCVIGRDALRLRMVVGTTRYGDRWLTLLDIAVGPLCSRARPTDVNSAPKIAHPTDVVMKRTCGVAGTAKSPVLAMSVAFRVPCPPLVRVGPGCRAGVSSR